jgi:tRNA(Ile)-lysidine synthase
VRRPPAAARVIERLTTTARAHDMFLPGQVVLVAVSGGPDSVCLLACLVRLRRLFRFRLEVAHVDHALRPDSAADAAYVHRMSDRLGLAFHLHRATSGPVPGESVEAWARTHRRAALAETARDIGASRIALGHTLDDQAETVLMHLITGSGLSGLAGIAPVAGPWVNPLLEVSRAEVEACCRSLGLRPRHDPTNDDPRFLRNALRLRAIPALEREVGREVIGPLARTAAALRPDADELDRMARDAAEEVAAGTPEGVDVEAVALLDLPRALAARVVSRAVYACGGVCTQADVEAVLGLAAGRPGRRCHLSGGVVAWRGRRHVHLAGSLDSPPT